MLDILSGSKTYITGLAMVFYAIAGMALGKVDFNQAAELVGTGLGLVFLRKGIAG